MPVGEIIGEILRPVFEIVIAGASYVTGSIFLNVVTLGSVKMAPLLSLGEKKKMKKGNFFTLGLFEGYGSKGRRLTTDAVCGVGFLVWVVLGFWIYFATQGDESSAASKKAAFEKVEITDPSSTSRGFSSERNENFSIRVEGEVNEPHTFKMAKQYIDSPLITLDGMIDRAKGITSFGIYLYVIRETPEYFEISKFMVRSVKSGLHEDFKLCDGDLIYVGHRESALNIERGVELLSANIQNRIKSSSKAIRWLVFGTHI